MTTYTVSQLDFFGQDLQSTIFGRKAEATSQYKKLAKAFEAGELEDPVVEVVMYGDDECLRSTVWDAKARAEKEAAAFAATVAAKVDDQVQFYHRSPCTEVLDVQVTPDQPADQATGDAVVGAVTFKRTGMNLVERGTLVLNRKADGSLKWGGVRDYDITPAPGMEESARHHIAIIHKYANA